MTSSSRPSRAGLFLALGAFFIHLVVVLAFSSDELAWDEPRYVEYATNLTKGYYTTNENPKFINGPGYPFALFPFVAVGLPLLLARFLNALLIGAATWFLWATVRHYAGGRWAAGAAIFMVMHPSLLRMTPFLMAEPLTMFCLTAFVWSFCRALREEKKSWAMIGVAAFSLGWLILTRVFFGHVLMATAFVLAGGFVFQKAARPLIRRALVILALALAMCVPYLAHTQSKTGQFLCWSTTTNELLYWFTSHNEGENGHWFSFDDAITKPELKPNHEEFHRRIGPLPMLKQEEEYKKVVAENLRAAPLKVARNWVCNVSRLFFGFPRSFQAEEIITLALIVPNGLLLLALLVALAVAVPRPSTLPAEIWILFAFSFFYLGGSTLAPSLPRYFIPVVPIMLLVVAVAFQRRLSLLLRP